MKNCSIEFSVSSFHYMLCKSVVLLGLITLSAIVQANQAPSQSASNSVEAIPERVTELLLLKQSYLDDAKRVYKQDGSFESQVNALFAAADKSLKAGPYSVTFNALLPASKNINDYFSVGPYWWPNPKTKSGLPWIRKDGKVNKAVRGDNSDSNQINGLIRNVETLALAYHFSDDPKYAKRAETLLRVFFIDPKTKMNPHLNFAQSIPGKTHGRGIGIIEFRSLARVLDGITIMQHEFDKELKYALDEWFTIFLGWLIESKNGQDEAQARNNHGTYYDLLVASLSLYLDLPQITEYVINNTKVRIKKQINEDGSQPHELERTRPFHYSIFNFIAFSNLASMAQKIDQNLWHYPSKQDQRIVKAYQFITNNKDDSEYWPGKQEKTIPIDRLIGPTLFMQRYYPQAQDLKVSMDTMLAQLAEQDDKKLQQQIQACTPLFHAQQLLDVKASYSYRTCIY